MQYKRGGRYLGKNVGHRVNSSHFAGLAVGTGLVLAGFVGANIIYPPVQNGPETELAATPPTEAEPRAPSQLLEEPPAEMPDGIPPQDLSEDETPPEPEPEAPLAEEMAPEDPQSDGPALQDLATQPPESESLPEDDMTAPEPEAAAPMIEDETPQPLALDSPQIQAQAPAADRQMLEDGAPEMPAAQDPASSAMLPARVASAPRADAALDGTQLPPPMPLAPMPDAPEESTGPLAEDAPDQQIAQDTGQTLPGTRVTGLPRIGADSDMPVTVDQDPVPEMTRAPALLRNSLYQSQGDTADKMALILSDPGLPMPIRRELAALDLPFTIALNPMDSGALEAAEIYFAAGKEVLILASGLPAGATASDIDVSLNAYFAALPLAVGVIDLPENGFARNAGLLREVLPLLAQDGHGLVTFAGGLTQAGRAAQAAGVAHTEVFRVLDAGNESVFTIRRYLDRAVFQASQIGHVIVFGDAANEETLDAIETWRAERRSGQVALVPVSGILLQND